MNVRPKDRLTVLPTALRSDGWQVSIGYRSMRDQAIDGVFPAHRVNNIWFFYRDETAAIAQALGLTHATTRTAA